MHTPDTLPKKSLLVFFGLTFAVTWALEIGLIINGMSFGDMIGQTAPGLWLVGVMWIPGLAALLTTKFVEKKDIRSGLSISVGRIGPYLLTIIAAPAIFLAMYGLTWMMGLSGYDPTLAGLAEVTDTPVDPESVFKVMLPLSMVIGPIFNFAFGLGEELGWRGFALPRLMPLGAFRANIILGILWGLWHAPLIIAGFNYPGYPILGIVMMCLMCIAFGLFINTMTLHYGSVLLAGFIHAAVNAQGYGIWTWLFPDADPILGGATGITGIAVWLIAGLLAIKVTNWLKS